MAPAAERLPDGSLQASRDAPIGGQAVLEGVMMRGVSTWALAVRKPPEHERAEDDNVLVVPCPGPPGAPPLE